MSRSKRIALRAYDYMTAYRIVVDALQAKGEPTQLTPTEISMVNVATEVCADLGLPHAQAEASILDVAAEIVRARHTVLFPVFDESEAMGDEAGSLRQIA